MPNFTPIGVSAEVHGLSGFTRDLGRMDSAIQKTGKNAGGIGAQFKGLGDSVLGFGAAAGKVAIGGIAALGTAVVGVGGVALKAASSYESAFTGVLKTTRGLEDEMGNLTELGVQLKEGFLDLAQTVPVSPETLAGIGELGGQLGIAEENLLEFSRTIADLDVATNLNAEEAALELAQFMNIMGTSEEDIGRLGSSIVHLGNNLATTERDIVNFASRIAGAGSIAGLTESQVLGIGAALSSVGIQAEAGGTAVQAALIEMNNAAAASKDGFVDHSAAIDDNVQKMTDLNAKLVTLEAQTGVAGDALWAEYEAFQAAGGSAEEFGRQLGDTQRAQLFKTIRSLKELTAETQTLRNEQGKRISPEALQTFARVSGLTADEFRKQWKEDAAGVFQLFVEGLGKEGDNAANVLDELGLGGARSARAFLSLANAGDLLTEAIGYASDGWEENTALSEEAERRYATFESQVQLLKNSLRRLLITAGEPILAFFGDLIKRIRPIIDEFGKKLPDAIKIFGDTLKGIFSGADLGGALGGGISQLGELFGIPPDVIARINDLVQRMVDLGTVVRNYVIMAFQWLQANVFPLVIQAFQFLMQHADAVKGALIGIGAVLGGAAIVAAIAAIGGVLAALVSPIGLIIAAAGLLGAAWAENWGGIRDILTNFWEGTARPALEQLWQWLQVNIPIALQTLSTFWQNTLLPALNTVWDFIVTSVIPALGDVWAWLSENVPAAVQTLSNYWTNVLLPSLRQAWSFFQGNILPVLRAVANVIDAVLGLAVRVLAGLWANILLPALTDVWSFIQTNVIPILEALWSVIAETLGPVIARLADEWLPKVQSGFSGIRDTLAQVTEFFNRLAENIRNVDLPEWLEPGSPTPFEIGLRGIGQALQTVVAAALQAFATQALAVFTKVRVLVQAVDAALNKIRSKTLPQLLVIVQETAALWVSDFTRIQPVLERINSLLSHMANLLLSVASNASMAADAMTNGFSGAADRIDDKLFDVLADLRDALEDVKTEAEAAASAVNSIGSAQPTGPGAGPGYQHGANFTVPPGFPRDTFPFRASTGEKVIVIPRGETAAGAMGGVEVNIGPVTISSDMDMAMFGQFVRREVSAALGGS